MSLYAIYEAMIVGKGKNENIRQRIGLGLRYLDLGLDSLVLANLDLCMGMRDYAGL